jgi:VacB/RNase II family 3'-5' exoribonuclease
MNDHDLQHRAILERIAAQAMRDRGLLPDFSTEAMRELSSMREPAASPGSVRDLRSMLWSSIDNDDSLDLDQLTVAQALPGDKIKIWVAIADVDGLVKSGSAIDDHAGHNTTSVYTAAQIFPMLPEKLSTDLTSLKFAEDRLALVVEMIVDEDGALQDSDLFMAWVHNNAKLAYRSVSAWLNGSGPMPAAIDAVKGLDDNLRLQDRAADRLHEFRHVHGALSLETIETHPVFDGDKISNLEMEEKNEARNLVENFMIAANGATARFLTERKYPSLRRVVRTPKRWDRIVEIAREQGAALPEAPDSKALEDFLNRQKARDPDHFPDLSLAIIKLLGPGEYIAEAPDGNIPGHFGLAVRDYSHSTAPNRRYSDLVTQRLLKAALAGQRSPYSLDQLKRLALNCTGQEDAANKVERQVNKSAAALLLEHHIGETYNAIVTGAASKGTWVRLLSIPVEGRVVQGFEGLDVGDRARVRLIDVNVERGFIDFALANH